MGSADSAMMSICTYVCASLGVDALWVVVSVSKYVRVRLDICKYVYVRGCVLQTVEKRQQTSHTPAHTHTHTYVLCRNTLIHTPCRNTFTHTHTHTQPRTHTQPYTNIHAPCRKNRDIRHHWRAIDYTLTHTYTHTYTTMSTHPHEHTRTHTHKMQRHQTS